MSSIDRAVGRSRPRIGVDFHTFDGIFQGSRSHVLNLFRSAIGLAPDMDFVFFLDQPELLRESHPEFGRANVTLVRMRHSPGLVRLGLQLPWLQFRHKIDLLHVQYRIPFVRLCPCACTIHDVLFESHPEYFSKRFVLYSKVTFRLAALRCSLLFTVSQYSRSEIANRYHIKPGAIRVLYNGVDRTRFFPGLQGREVVRSLDLEPGDYLLMVGRLEPRKNHARLIEAYSRLDSQAPPLVCVGQRDFGYGPALEAATRFGVEGRVRFLEGIADDVLPALMRNARAFVYPAIAEGFGMPVAEALASGVPVVTSRTTSLPEVVGNAAVLVDPLDVESIADGMRRVLHDEALAKRLLAEGARRVLRFDWEQSARTLVAAYRESFSTRYVVSPATNGGERP